jgi:hypothetical protein
MTQQEFLVQIAQRLESVGIAFMVAGSVASSFHGQPRATNDIDLVIAPTHTQLDQFLALFADPYYVSAEAARDALKQNSMFNIIEFTSGWKVDLIIRKARPFSIEEFQRRKVEVLQGCTLPIASPEDVMLSKLEWNLITPSDRQVQDALNVAMAQWPTLDLAYLRKWAANLGVAEPLEELLKTAGEQQP